MCLWEHIIDYWNDADYMRRMWKQGKIGRKVGHFQYRSVMMYLTSSWVF